MFNPNPLSENDRTLRAGRETVPSAPARRLFSVERPINHTAGTEKEMLETKNGNGFVVIGKGTHIVGEISNCSKIEIDGYLEGSIIASEVIVSVGGCLKGHVRTERAEVHGTIEGHVQVQDHLDIRSTGQASGELFYGKLSVAPGGKLVGNIQGHVQPDEGQEAPGEPFEPINSINENHAQPARRFRAGI